MKWLEANKFFKDVKIIIQFPEQNAWLGYVIIYQQIRPRLVKKTSTHGHDLSFGHTHHEKAPRSGVA